MIERQTVGLVFLFTGIQSAIKYREEEQTQHGGVVISGVEEGKTTPL